MGEDDPTLPGRLRRVGRQRDLSTRALRVVNEVAPLITAAFTLPDGPERDAQLTQAIGRAIDAGREAGDATREELVRLRGELADAQQAVALLREKNNRLTAAHRELSARLARLSRAEGT